MPVKPLAAWARALSCSLALLLPLQGLQAQVPSQVRLPALGESAAEDFNVGTERKLGDQVMGEIRRDPDYLDDPVLLEYLQALWQPLVDVARTRGDIDVDTGAQFAWEAFLVRDKSVNAFALPGGFIGVHLGLIAMTATRDELASVLAHELSHVTQRHIARSVASQSRQSLLGVAGLILALLAASRSNNPDVAQAAIVGGQAAMMQGQLNFSRDMEREADRVGFAVLGQAGYDPAGMSAMFEKLDVANRLNDNGAYPYLRSHPLTLERQSEARLRAQGVHTATPPLAQTLHPLMAARARVLMDTSVVSLRRLQEPPAPKPGQTSADRLAGLYASALASSLLRDHAQAERRIGEARALLGDKADPEQLRAFALLDAEGRIGAGDLAGAQAQLARVQGQWPAAGQARPVLLLHAHAALQRRDGERDAGLRSSLEALQTWVTAQPRDASAWMLLGTTADALGLRLRALRAQAESRWLLGDLTGAMDRLRTGRTLARNSTAGQDFIEVSIIDARLRELDTLRRAQMAEQRGGRSGGGRGGEGGPPPEDRTDKGDSKDGGKPLALQPAFSTSAR